VNESLGPEGSGGRRERLSIEQRAARRDRITGTPGDRYHSLLRALRAGREVPIAPRRGLALEWHPIFWTLIRIVIVAAVLYLVVSAALGWWRSQHVDTWTGPAQVQSGQQLSSCPALGVPTDDRFPAWIRVGGAVYGMTDGIRPVVNPEAGKTSYAEAGATLGAMRLLYDDSTPAGSARDYVLAYIPPSLAARVYDRLPGCQ